MKKKKYLLMKTFLEMMMIMMRYFIQKYVIHEMMCPAFQNIRVATI